MRKILVSVGVSAILSCGVALSENVTLPAAASIVGGAPFFSDVRAFNTSYTAPLQVTATYRCFIPNPCTTVGHPVEMERSGKRTFCCGAGGAHMWMEERGTPINEERVREAAETGAETLAVACPFCTVMLDDGVRSMGKQLRVVDVSTLLVESMEE